MTDQAMSPRTLSRSFNSKSIKSEDDIKVGVRKDEHGNTRYLRNGKILNTVWADGSKDSHGAEVKLKALDKQATEAQERRREGVRAALKPPQN